MVLQKSYGFELYRVQPVQLYMEAPPGYNSGLLFVSKHLSGMLSSGSNMNRWNRFSFVTEAEHTLWLHVDVMSVAWGRWCKWGLFTAPWSRPSPPSPLWPLAMPLDGTSNYPVKICSLSWNQLSWISFCWRWLKTCVAYSSLGFTSVTLAMWLEHETCLF